GAQPRDRARRCTCANKAWCPRCRPSNAPMATTLPLGARQGPAISRESFVIAKVYRASIRTRMPGKQAVAKRAATDGRCLTFAITEDRNHAGAAMDGRFLIFAIRDDRNHTGRQSGFIPTAWGVSG